MLGLLLLTSSRLGGVVDDSLDVPMGLAGSSRCWTDVDVILRSVDRVVLLRSPRCLSRLC